MTELERIAGSAQLEEISRELKVLQAEVDELGEEVQTRRQVLDDFTKRYRREIAPLMERVEQLELELARALGTDDSETEARADRAAAANVQSDQVNESPSRPTATEEVKRTLRDQYRSLARLLHPDLSVNEDDRSRRTTLMAKLNDAWTNGDADALDLIEADAVATRVVDPEADDVDQVLSSCLRARDILRARILTLQADIDAIDSSALEQLRARAEAARNNGDDLLADLATKLERRATMLETQLVEVG